MIGSKLSVKNFLGLNIQDLEIGDVTVFIGPQASGKSVVAKLIYFFYNYVKDLEEITRYVENLSFDKRLENYDEKNIGIFLRLFPRESWGEDDFEIHYKKEEIDLVFRRKGKETSITLSEDFLKRYKDLAKKRLDMVAFAKKIDVPVELADIDFPFQLSLSEITSISERRKENKSNPAQLKTFLQQYKDLREEIEQSLSRYEDALYIPAARAFFATLRDEIFTVMGMDQTIDFMLLQFGRAWQRMRNFRSVRFYRGRLLEENKSGKRCFSEWQNLLKASYERENEKDFLVLSDNRKIPLASASSGQQELLPLLMGLRDADDYGLMIIEEPEAHIFPEAQVEITKMIVEAGQKHCLPIIVATHSPYVLSAVNNEILKNEIALKKDKKTKKLNVKTYGFENGGVKNLIDTDTGLIVAEYIDDASNILGDEFETLCNDLQSLEEADDK